MNSLTISVSVSIVLMIAVLVFQGWFIRKLEIKERLKDPLNNCFLILATFIGVALAIYFTNQQTEQEKRKKCVTAIQITSSNLRDFEHFLDIEKSDTGAMLRSVWRINRTTPDLVVLDMPDAFILLYARTFFDLAATKKTLTNTMRFVDDHLYLSDSSLKVEFDQMKHWIELMNLHLDWEDEYQKGDLSEKGLEARYHVEHLSLYGHDYD